MIKNLKTVRAGIVMGILLVSMFVSLFPTASAGAGFLPGVIKINYDSSQVPESITPLSGKAVISLEVYFMVTGLGSGVIIPFYDQNVVQVELSVGEHPDWVVASISPGFVNPHMSTTFADPPGEQATLTVSVKQDAPAFESGNIEVLAQTKTYPPVQAAAASIQITIKPGYVASVGFETPYTFKEMGPGETVSFPINLKNRANGRTEVHFEILDNPEGWSPSINTITKLGSEPQGEDPTETVNLVVQSPFNVGYHNTVERFRIKTTAMWEQDHSIGETEYILEFRARSRGFSTPGFDIAVLAMSLIVGVMLIRRKQQKK